MNKTPEEVLKSISDDFRNKRITRAQAAKMLGYSNVQSVANLLSIGRQKVKYLSPIQASRYSKTFGYSEKFLTSGEGSLNEQGDFFDYNTQYEDENLVWEQKYRELLAFVMNLIPFTNNRFIGPIFDSYLEGNYELVKEALEHLKKLQDSHFHHFHIAGTQKKQEYEEYRNEFNTLSTLLKLKRH